MASPNEKSSGGRKKTAARKNMKRCSHCGAKNKDTFEYCVRCSEPLDDDAGAWVDPSERRSPIGTILVAGVLGIVALAALALITGSSGDAPAPPAARRTAPPSPPAERRAEPILEGVDSEALLAIYHEGLAAYNAQDYDLAIEKLSEVVRDIPDNPLVHRYLGLSYYHRGDLQDAMTALDEARTLRPDTYELLVDYVTVSKEAGETDEALSALQSYVTNHPNEVEARLEIARIARASGNDALALEQSQYLATADDLDPEFVYEYGITLKQAGQLDEAKAVLRNSIQLDPSSAVAHHALGVTELVSGNARAALGPLEEAVARDPSSADFQFSLAQAYEKLDRIEDSLRVYDAYLERARPGDPRANVVRRQLPLAKKALDAERQASKE